MMMTTRGAVRFEGCFRGLHKGALALALISALAAIGCGSSSSNSIGPGEKFLGKWELDTLPSTFNLACASGQGLTGVAVWGQLDFEHGVLTDLTESSGACPPRGVAFNADSKGTLATAVVPDPYSSTGSSPICDLSLGTDASGNPEDLVLTFSSLTFTLLSTSSASAPGGLLSGSATGAITVFDLTTGATSTLDTCTYTGSSDRYHQMTQP